MAYLFDPAPQPVIEVEGQVDLPIHRVFCVGRNYAAHAAEMGNEVDRAAPFYFTKSAHSVTCAGAEVAYPPRTADLHHEVELVVALGAGGQVIAHGVGLDMTRRDLQAVAKDKRRPWDVAKDFEQSAVLAPMRAVSGDALGNAKIALDVNGVARQRGRIADMVWSVDELVGDLSGLYQLRAGDLIMTGTPSGVGPVSRGDRIVARIDGLPELTARIV
ncbi:fumarylacetoacetate hydrolase family protein [Maribius pontilimi]|uniref:Fumarylacetoacetate hydrolase family protein n=1 Tax=Palleronia pontilimi TaxID=1964209 RepID=A0A934IHA7_9RHOB|nr:fumarylacetoacetate hydrolase family protein [Palleronia pontilimi]MBJ3761864.1 fumarylacetoacetate hydrolase family protein [Palleronia pontilimi]